MSTPNQSVPPPRKYSGEDFLRNKFYNKSTAFTLEERFRLGIAGRLPPNVETLDEQVHRAYVQLKRFDAPINRYQFLRSIQDNNTVLFYALITKYLTTCLPIIYTPTVGEACLKFGRLYQKEHGLYITLNDKSNVKPLVQNMNRSAIDVVVVTDGSRILGLGDLGTNGMGIPIGKCSLYVAAGGIHPRRALPVMFDVGTNNEEYLNDPMYLGIRAPRAKDEDFYALMDEFMATAAATYPTAVIQFEDFSNNHCFDVLERYRNKYRCFNDDIQGTGAVIAAGFVNAVRLSKVPAAEHRIVVYGAGSAAVGVVSAIAGLVAFKFKVPQEQVLKGVYLVDTKGLVTTTRGDKLAAHKVALARTDIAAEDNAKYASLFDVVKLVRPTALIGLAGAGPAFTEEMVRFMTSYCARPIIFPLSNPTSQSEISAQQAFEWTKGAAIVASGSPYPPTTVNGKTHKCSQGNNMYIFPGVGLGAAIAQLKTISDESLMHAAAQLAGLVEDDALEKEEALYPPLEDIRDVSAHIAAAVMLDGVKSGAATAADLPHNLPDLVRLARERMWNASYEESEFYYSNLEESKL